MSDVLNKVPRSLVQFLDRRGVAPDEVFARVRDHVSQDSYLERDYIMHDPGRMPWSSFCDFCEAISPYFKEPSDFEEYQRFNYRPGQTWTPYLRVTALLIVDFANIYPFINRVLGPSGFGDVIRPSIETLQGRGYRIHLELAPNARPNPFFFRMTLYGMITAPELFGQPSSTVEAEISGTSGTYLVYPPPSQTLWARAKRYLTRTFGMRVLTEEIVKQDKALREGYRRLQQTVADLDHAKAELESRVEARTRELNAANARLHERLQELMVKEQENHQLTERVLELQMKEQQLQKLDSLGTLAAGMSHKINNALHGIFLALDLADRKLADDHPAKESLRIAMKFAASGQQTTNQIAAFSRQVRTQSEALDLMSVVQLTMKRVRAELPSGIQLVERETRGFHPIVHADRFYIERIVLNLCSNAVYSMREHGGKLEVAVQSRGDDKVVIEVVDEGDGIAEENMPRIYDPFFTTKPLYEGSGLGLAVVYGIVQSLGGSIQARRGPNAKGARFEVTLPMDRLIEAEDLPAPESAGGSERLLVVEDEPDLLELLADTLRAFGYDVTTAPSGRAALDLLYQKSFDLIITDHLMADINGVELARALRETAPDTPLILCTGHHEDLTEPELKWLFKRVVSKPIDAYQLNEAIRASL